MFDNVVKFKININKRNCCLTFTPINEVWNKEKVKIEKFNKINAMKN